MLRIWAWKMEKTMVSLQAFLSFLPRAPCTPKFLLPLPLLMPAMQAIPSIQVFFSKWEQKHSFHPNKSGYDIWGFKDVQMCKDMALVASFFCLYLFCTHGCRTFQAEDKSEWSVLNYWLCMKSFNKTIINIVLETNKTNNVELLLFVYF